MKRKRDRGDYRYLTPGLAAFAFLITIFAAFATRAGVLGGVHQFAGGPGAELARLLSGNWILSNITRLLAVGSLMLTSLVTYKYSKEKGFNSRMPTIYLTGMGVISLIAIFDISAFYEIFRELSATIYPSDPFLGSVAVFGGLLGIPVFLTYSFSEGENGKFKIREILEDKYTILLTVGLLFLGTLVILILMGMGAGGVEDQAAFNSRLPYFTIPLALALIICSTRRPFGIRGVGYAIGIAIFAGLVTFGIFQGLGLHGFELGVYAVAVAAPISKIDSLMGRRGKGKLRVAGLLLLIAGILGIILWSSNPESAWPFIESAGLPLRTSMVILSTIALLGGFSAYRRASWRLSLLGALAGIVTFSIWVGAAISLFALLMIALKRREFTRDGFSFSRLRPLMRVSSHHLIHVGLALLLVGFVLSTYMEREDQIETLGMGEEKSALGYDFKLTGSGGRMDDRGMIEEVYAELAISGGGLSKANLSMEWWTGGGIEPHMMKQVAVTSKLKEDIYLIPNAFWTPSDGWKQSMSMSKFRSSDVQAVSFEVRTLPGMNVLWGGMWIMMVSIGMLIATEVISKRETEKRKVKRWEEEYRKEIFG
ncbi:hypothetical protein AKJ45_03155 [candidate division MSBL1 archaeon SCGC-AAA261F19]|uniref:Cytochrome c-type biogenesis protein CcmF C-terminal domain-containing protein n=1 Tax=candidate division MSBL1 archaeon SCGC-AAA261F19 TaxID=1698275 RepID=A0A133V902_9EURY|nr:hypothetical protein AKJ45_03155 [candidate division MSBL1 archaeon SCGC-AAA261F19]